jgi:hypothetical protein
MTEIPQNYRDLFSKPAFAHLVTLMPGGSPQVTPSGSISMALEISDPANPYRYVQVRGRIPDITEEGADAHIDKISPREFAGVGSPRTTKKCWRGAADNPAREGGTQNP